MTRRLIAFLIVFIATVSMSIADDTTAVTKLAKSTTKAIVTLLRDESLTDDTCKGKVRLELEKVFDFALTAKLTLGRKYWPLFNEEQREEFRNLFVNQLVDGYFRKAKTFSDEEVKYDDAVKVGNKVHIGISFASKGDKIYIKNKFYKSPSGWKIYDMEIQDISIVRSYGKQYAEVLRGGAAADLLKKMRDKKAEQPQEAQ